MELSHAILLAFGGNAMLLAVLAFGGRSVINHWIAKSETEHSIRFSSFFDKQAEAIATTYALARKFNSRLREYLEIPDITLSGSRDERRREAAISHREFIDYFEQKQIYLPKRSVEIINKINIESKEIFNKYLYQVEHKQSTPETAQEWLGLIDRVQTELENTFNDLEKEFRDIVGNKS